MATKKSNNDVQLAPEFDSQAPPQFAQPQPPMMQQPIQQQYNPNPQHQPQPMMQQPVQYIMMERSLKGIGGWMVFFMICFGLAAISYIWMFFASMLNLSSVVSILTFIFSPILASGYIMAIVLMSMEKKIAKMITWTTIGVSVFYTTINTIVAYVTTSNVNSSYAASRALPLVIAGILVSIIIHGLVALYFWKSKRVNETLVK